VSTYLAPVRTSVDVTYACDLRCIHCRTNTGEIPRHIRRKMLSVDELADVIRQLDDMNVFEITLTGGEPTIRKGFYTTILGTVGTLRYSTATLITNAANHSEDQILSIIAAGVRSVRVSIDGTAEVFRQVRLIDRYETVIRNLEIYARHVPSVKVLTTVMKTNLHDVMDLVRQLQSIGVRRQDLILVRAHGRGGRNSLLLTEQETLALYHEVEEFRRRTPSTEYDLNFNAPYLFPNMPRSEFDDVVMWPYLEQSSSIAISATGDVTMNRLYSSDPIGNVKDAKLQDIWERGREQLAQESLDYDEERLRKIFWQFPDADGERDANYALTSLLDRQIFENAAVR
jgi:MoaA/NifB/PqqE/SkfB family radical SAM enzyme